MPKETSPARRSVAKYLPKDSASPEDHRGRWQVGRDREIDAPDETDDDSQQAVEDDGKEHGDLYRAGKIDAYMRYLKMQPPVREAEPVTLRQSVSTRERPAHRFFDQEEEPREVRYHGYQQRAIRHPSPRGAHLSARRPQRRTGTEIAIAVTLSLAAAGVTGLIVYDRTSGGTLAQGFATRLSGLSGGTAAPTAPLPVATVKPAPITVAGISGYTYSFTSPGNLLNKEVVFIHGDNIFQFSVTSSPDRFDESRYNHMINSIKFLD